MNTDVTTNNTEQLKQTVDLDEHIIVFSGVPQNE